MERAHDTPIGSPFALKSSTNPAWASATAGRPADSLRRLSECSAKNMRLGGSPQPSGRSCSRGPASARPGRIRREQKEGTAEQIGEAIDHAARVASRRAKNLGANVEAALKRARSEIQNFGVEARITGRLTWDKELQGSHIELDVNDQGVAVLRGTVPTAAARLKAGGLTLDTIGVRRVVDELKVENRADEAPPSGQP